MPLDFFREDAEGPIGSVPTQETIDGETHSWCRICGRVLTNPGSVAAGIGPICNGRQAKAPGEGSPRRGRKGKAEMEAQANVDALERAGAVPDVDYTHYYHGFWSDGAKCRIRIFYRTNMPPVIVCSEHPDNDNTSITNLAEYLAAEVCQDQGITTIFGSREHPPFVWVEHYPERQYSATSYDPLFAESFDFVVFDNYEFQETAQYRHKRNRVKFGSPVWAPATADDVLREVLS